MHRGPATDPRVLTALAVLLIGLFGAFRYVRRHCGQNEAARRAAIERAVNGAAIAWPEPNCGPNR